MRKILIMLLILIFLAGAGVMAINGITIAGITIPSVKQILDENDELDYSIEVLQDEIDTDYASAQRSLSTSVSELEAAKQSYQDLVTYSTAEELQAATQTDEYDIDYLWTKIGLYATKNNLTIAANVTSGTVSGLYNITISVLGEYISISEFVYSIENDSDLGFKISNFTMTGYQGDTLQATFVIQDISLNEESLIEAISTSSSSTSSDTSSSSSSSSVIDTLTD